MARSYTYITKYTSPNQNARNSKITGITCHWWARPTGQNPEGIVSWLCDKRAGTSAHYVVSEGTVCASWTLTVARGMPGTRARTIPRSGLSLTRICLAVPRRRGLLRL